MESYNCDPCGVVNFKNQANFKKHQKDMHCKTTCERKERPSTSKGHVEAKDVHIS